MVDDEPNILRGYTRLFKDRFAIETAEGGIEALKKLKEDSFAVVLTDLRMPEMSGVDLLREARTANPETIRMMISGNADLEAAIEAVNEGSVFRFLTKPCADEDLERGLKSGLEQYRLIRAEKELLDQTLNGAIQTLVDMISILDADAFGRAQTRRIMAAEIAKALGLESTWDVEIGAMLADIGYMTVPTDLARKHLTGLELSSAEKSIITQLPQASSQLIGRIPRMESVAQCLLYQNKNYDGTGFPSDTVAGEAIPIGARMIRVIKAMIAKYDEGIPLSAAIEGLKSGGKIYDPEILRAADAALPHIRHFLQSEKHRTQMLSVQDLRAGYILRSNVESKSGMLILQTGQLLRMAHLQRIHNFSQLSGVKEPICVEIPSGQ